VIVYWRSYLDLRRLFLLLMLLLVDVSVSSILFCTLFILVYCCVSGLVWCGLLWLYGLLLLDGFINFIVFISMLSLFRSILILHFLGLVGAFSVFGQLDTGNPVQNLGDFTECEAQREF